MWDTELELPESDIASPAPVGEKFSRDSERESGVLERKRERDVECVWSMDSERERERDRVLRITFLERETWFQPSTDTEGREREREAKCEESKSDARQRELRVCSYWGLMCRIITRLPLCELCICFWDLLCYAMLRLYCLVLVRPFGLCVSYDDEAI